MTRGTVRALVCIALCLLLGACSKNYTDWVANPSASRPAVATYNVPGGPKYAKGELAQS